MDKTEETKQKVKDAIASATQNNLDLENRLLPTAVDIVDEAAQGQVSAGDLETIEKKQRCKRILILGVLITIMIAAIVLIIFLLVR